MSYFPFAIVKVIGNSMMPTKRPGDFLFVSPLPYRLSDPKINDIVIVHNNNRAIVKRIKKIDGTKYFVVGDNTDASTDSRSFGWLTRTEILAKVIW